MAPPRRAAAVSAASNLAASASGNRNASESKPKGSSNTKKNGKQSQKEANSDVPVASSSKPPPPVIPLSPIITRLRTMWKFAAICQFLFTFDEAFGFSGFESDALENDLNGPENQIIPDLFRRLLYTLTLNRTIDEANWEDHLRKQYINRDPDAPLLGTIEEPRSWHALPLQQKVDSIHTLCEWQLWDAEKFRKLVKNEEDAEVWRIDPIGWDAEDNTYWLFDDNRLWIQHPPPTPPPAAKAKAPAKKSSKKAKAEARREAQKRKREAEANASISNIDTPAKSSRSTPAKPSARLPRTPPTRSSPRSRLANGESAPKQPRSTRSSRRTGDWEEIPAELLYDGDSDLSDPPEDDVTAMEVDTTAEVDIKNEGDESEAIKEEGSIEGEASNTKAEEGSVKDEESTNATNGTLKNEENGNTGGEAEIKEEAVQPEVNEWIEFEALAVTRQEWEWMSSRFAKSRHPDEKALHQLLKDTVLPKVIADLDEADKQKAHELAMANRKRSSRIALKESEREEKERDRIARQKMEEKMAAIRAEEDEKVRKEQEEANMIRIREERLHEREARLMAREREAEERAQREIDEKEERERLRELRKLKREQIIANGGQPPDDDQDLDAKDDDSWELDCEVCGRNGINLDDTDEIVCCEQCGKWQHTECWNAFDRRIGRNKRDWENEDFYCSNCRPPLPGQPRPQPPTFQSFVQQSASSTQSSKANTPVVPSQRSPVQETFSYPSAAAYSAERNERQQNSFPNYTTLYGNYQNNIQQPGHYTYQPPQQQSNYRPFAPPMQTMQGQPQFAQRPMMNTTQAPPTNAMSAPKVPQPFAGSGQSHPAANTPHPQQNVGSSQIRPTAPSPMPQQNAQSEQYRPLSASPNPRPTPQQYSGSQQNHSTAPSPRPQQSVDNGQNLPPVAAAAAAAAASSPRPQQNQTGSGKPNGSPTYNYPVRSPGSMNGGQSVPRNTQPSGSFPLRHTPARSPLSGPHRESPLSMPNMSIGPPVRSSSPSPMKRQSQQTTIPLTAGRPAPPPPPPQQQQQLNNSMITSNSNQGPGPSSGSLARPSTMQPTNPIQHANGASQPIVNKSHPSPLAPVPDHVPQSTPSTTVPASTTTTTSNTAPQH